MNEYKHDVAFFRPTYVRRLSLLKVVEIERAESNFVQAACERNFK